MFFQIALCFIAVIFRTYLNKNYTSTTIRHLFCLIFGFLVVRYIFNPIDALELLILPTIVYGLITVLPLQPIISLIVCMSFSSYYQILSMQAKDFSGASENDVGLVLNYMIMVQKLTSLSYSYYDGLMVKKHQKKQDAKFQLAKVLDNEVIDSKPTYLEVLAYSYCFFGVLGGPRISFRHYKQVIENDTNESKIGSKLYYDIFYTVFFSVLSVVLKEVLGLNADKLFLDRKNWFDHPDTKLWQKLTYQIPLAIQYRTEFYFFWYLCEILNNLAGFGFDIETKKWNLATSIRPYQVETATDPQIIVNNWNLQTTKWLQIVAYQRAPRKFAALYVFLLSSIWHGFWIGQYIFLFYIFFMLEAMKNIRYTMTPWVYTTFGGKFYSSGVIIYNLVGWFIFDLVFSYPTVMFVSLLNFSSCWHYLKGTYFIPFILVMLAAKFPLKLIFGKVERKKREHVKVEKKLQ